MSKNKLLNDVDRHVGRCLRWRRRELKRTQKSLADKMGLTFQQIQKYERGVNRVTAGRLWEFAKVLEVDILYFFNGLEEMEEVKSKAGGDEELSSMIDANSVDLVIAFKKIKNEKMQQSFLNMVKNAAETFQNV